MKIVFMGTPDFAEKALRRLYEDGHEIVAVFTQPDKPRNRGMKVSFSPVKILATEHGTPIYQPISLRTDESIDLIRGLTFDLLVVVAYGKILPKSIIDIPPLGCVNIHGSVLPKYRGPAPIQWAIINGETKSGVTSQFMNEKIDSGDIILTKELEINDDETAGELYERLSVLGAELLSDTVKVIASGNYPRIPQDDSLATHVPLITKDLLPISWDESAHRIRNKVRGLAPKPAATANFDGLTVKVFRVEIGESTAPAQFSPGEIVSKGKQGIEIACADGTVIIKELQAPGGKRMSAADFLRGRA